MALPYTGSKTEEVFDEKIFEEKNQAADFGPAKDAGPAGLPNVSWAELKEEAERAEEYEHSLTLWQSVKVYKAVS